MSTATAYFPPVGSIPTQQQMEELVIHEYMASPPAEPIGEILHESMQVSPEVAKLFLNILRPQPQTHVYINRLDHCYPVVGF